MRRFLKKALAFAILATPAILFLALVIGLLYGLVMLFIANWIVGLIVLACFAIPALVVCWDRIDAWAERVIHEK